jgi:hypothetical protein
MAGHVPDWVHASIQQGYIVKARCPDGDISRVAFGEKGYLLFGRNGQVLRVFLIFSFACALLLGLHFKIVDVAEHEDVVYHRCVNARWRTSPHRECMRAWDLMGINSRFRIWTLHTVPSFPPSKFAICRATQNH